MAIKDLIQNNTNEIIEIRELLGGLGDKDGQYVWKKYGKVIVAGDVIATCIGAGSAISWQLSATNGSLKSLTKKDLVGLKLTNSTNVSQYLNIDSETSSTWRFSASYTYTQEWTYDDATKTITVPTNVGGSVGDKYNVSGVTFNVESLTFVDFVVSDDETAYPDGEEQGGYWYELLKEEAGITPEMFGCTKMAVDKVTFSTRTKMGADGFPHTLGESPKLTIIRSDPNRTKVANDFIEGVGTNLTDATVCLAHWLYWNYASVLKTNYNANISATPTNVFGNGDNSVYYSAGVEYTIITMA